MITNFNNFINESFFKWNNKKEEEYPSFVYDCNEVDYKDLHFNRLKEFDYEEKKYISLFLGDHIPMTKKHLSVFQYTINKNIGFGLSIYSKKSIKATVTKNEGIDNKTYYLLELKYPTKIRTFLCGNLKSCFKKIKEIEKSNEEIESKDNFYKNK